MINSKNIRPLNSDQLQYLVEKYKFTLEGNRIKIELSLFPNRIMYFEIGKKNILFFTKKVFGRYVYHILDDAKKIYIEKQGKWNLIFINQLLFLLIKQNIDYTTLSNEEIEEKYNELVLEQFILKG